MKTDGGSLSSSSGRSGQSADIIWWRSHAGVLDMECKKSETDDVPCFLYMDLVYLLLVL